MTRRVLLAYAVHDPAVGYCQSLNFVAAMLLLVARGEAGAFGQPRSSLSDGWTGGAIGGGGGSLLAARRNLPQRAARLLHPADDGPPDRLAGEPESRGRESCDAAVCEQVSRSTRAPSRRCSRRRCPSCTPTSSGSRPRPTVAREVRTSDAACSDVRTTDPSQVPLEILASQWSSASQDIAEI